MQRVDLDSIPTSILVSEHNHLMINDAHGLRNLGRMYLRLLWSRISWRQRSSFVVSFRSQRVQKFSNAAGTSTQLACTSRTASQGLAARMHSP